MAAENAGMGERLCYNCNKPGHMRDDCPDLPAVAREILNKQRKQAGRGCGRGKDHGKGGGGPGVAGISIANVQSILDNLPGGASAFLYCSAFLLLSDTAAHKGSISIRSYQMDWTRSTCTTCSTETWMERAICTRRHAAR